MTSPSIRAGVLQQTKTSKRTRLEATAILWLLLRSAPVVAQPVTSHSDGPKEPAAGQHQHAGAEPVLILFPAREASGTAWVPDETPMYAVHRTWRGWEVMLHGTVVAQFLYEPGDRHRTGGSATHQWSSVNWAMGMARRPVATGRVGVRAMISVEPWTVSDCGYLNFLATGETCQGDTIHDRQHPHDLFMELAADYDRPLRGSLRWQLYAGLAGEPALGPPGFPHRVSAMPNPIAPISHHWLDSTHLTFGVVTAGLYDRKWKAEMSAFNGREPDDDRADLDLAPLDSFSGRLSWLPSARLALQVSAGHLHEAEAAFAARSRTHVNRATASATYHRGLANAGLWATTLAWGVNAEREIIAGDLVSSTTHAVLLESNLTRHERETWFGRAELVEKPAHDLHAHEFTTQVFTVGRLVAGYVRYLPPWKGAALGVGGAVAASLVPAALAPRYGGRIAPGFNVFATVRPARHVM
ncbi:MAG: hypothetical protein ACT4QD_11820 [Acidobacteriota bacterium]